MENPAIAETTLPPGPIAAPIPRTMQMTVDHKKNLKVLNIFIALSK
jgi:hypothetical protein